MNPSKAYQLGRKIRGGIEIAALAAIAFTAIIVVPVTIAYGIASFTCSRQWARSGMAAEYGILQGCQVQLKHGHWVPADSFKSVETE